MRTKKGHKSLKSNFFNPILILSDKNNCQISYIFSILEKVGGLIALQLFTRFFFLCFYQRFFAGVGLFVNPSRNKLVLNDASGSRSEIMFFMYSQYIVLTV